MEQTNLAIIAIFPKLKRKYGTAVGIEVSYEGPSSFLLLISQFILYSSKNL